MVQQQGIYTLADASRLVGITPSRLRRWLDARHQLVPGAYRGDGFSGIVSYKDLLEARVIAGLRPRFTLKRLGDAIRLIQEMHPSPYPLLSGKLAVEGSRFLHVKQTGKKGRPAALVNSDDGQLAIPDMIKVEDAEKVADAAMNILSDVKRVGKKRDVGVWKPAAGNDLIVLDPSRLFGAPIVARLAIPTRDIVKANEQYGGEAAVIKLYDLEYAEFAAALAFERSLDAMKARQAA